MVVGEGTVIIRHPGVGSRTEVTLSQCHHDLDLSLDNISANHMIVWSYLLVVCQILANTGSDWHKMRQILEKFKINV